MTGSRVIRSTPHWLVSFGDNEHLQLHLVFTPLAADRVADLAALMLDEREDLYDSIRAEVQQHNLDRYTVYVRCAPGIPLEVHLTVEPSGSPCPGLAVTGPEQWVGPTDEVGFLLQLANAVKCPLCGMEVAQWRISDGRMGHDPGE